MNKISFFQKLTQKHKWNCRMLLVFSKKELGGARVNVLLKTAIL